MPAVPFGGGEAVGAAPPAFSPAAAVVLPATIFAVLVFRLHQEPCFVPEVPLHAGVVACAAPVVAAVLSTPIFSVLVFASASRACACST